MGIPNAQATVAKAPFDFLYLRPRKNNRRLVSFDLAEDLLPLFEQRFFVEAWLERFKDNFTAYSKEYSDKNVGLIRKEYLFCR